MKIHSKLVCKVCPIPPQGPFVLSKLKLILVGCADILELDVDHDRHLKYIVRIRYAIHSEGSWEDVSAFDNRTKEGRAGR
jgi:hypothetical protein